MRFVKTMKKWTRRPESCCGHYMGYEECKDSHFETHWQKLINNSWDTVCQNNKRVKMSRNFVWMQHEICRGQKSRVKKYWQQLINFLKYWSKKRKKSQNIMKFGTYILRRVLKRNGNAFEILRMNGSQSFVPFVIHALYKY